MRQIGEDIGQLRRLNDNLGYLEKRRKLKNKLKIALIGFLIWKDLDEEIVKEETIRDSLLIRLGKLVLDAEKDFDLLIKRESFVSKKELSSYIATWFPIASLLDEFRALISFRIEPKTIEYLEVIFKNGDQIIETRNNEFIKKELEKYKDFFDNFGDFPLTDEQRRAIITDEYAELVIAGAGSGKTTTIAGKAAYLNKKGIKPEEILCLAYGVEVKDTIKERVGERYSENVRTIHGLGRHIALECGDVDSYTVSELAKDKIAFRKKISDFIAQRAKDKNFQEKIKDYFLKELEVNYRSLFDFKSMDEYIEFMREYEPRTLDGKKLKSCEECEIANFLFLNGIDYEYEPLYQAETGTPDYKSYHPDFYLPKYKLYIEHFGIGENHTPSRIYKDPDEYWTQMLEKRDTHKRHGTTLIETYSYQKKKGILLKVLKEKLLEKGVEFNPIPNEMIFQKLIEKGRVAPLSYLLSKFLNLYKSTGEKITDLRNRLSPKDKRAMVFLDIFSYVLQDYSEYLNAFTPKQRDFNDMINEAITLTEEGKYLPKFKYILVDEFQDISQNQYRLIKTLQDKSNCKIFCVGDDWQSIYSYSGADVSILLKFSNNFEFSGDCCYLTQTFRFDQSLCDFTTKFILKNTNQIPKKITSIMGDNKGTPAVSVIRNEGSNGLDDILSKIEKKREGDEILILGRYKKLKPIELKKLQTAHRKLKIDYMTIHRSKGLQRDYVIIVGLKGGKHGFPNKIEDDPILDLVSTKEDKPYPYAEERRLFYVATTRAKKHVYLVVEDEFDISEFIKEIENEEYKVNIKSSNNQSMLCPNCEIGKMIKRPYSYGFFYRCSNYPLCEYEAQECNSCHNGFRYRKDNRYHCSNCDYIV
ncbi:MAG: UvrD-helicase domain-containing protein [Candidatus Bathyarchaeia archaeon]|jgi:DNA helicase-4